MVGRMNKLVCFMDVDGVILNSVKCMADYYNYYRSNHDKEITSADIKTWNAKEALIGYSDNDVETIFKSRFFWRNVERYNGIRGVLSLLQSSGKFDVIPTSIGSSENISQKTLYLQEHFPFLDNQILLVKNKNCSPGKSIINMSNGLICDDNVSNLISSNAKYRILVKFDGEDKEWSQGWNGSTVRAPDELYQEVMACWELENRNGGY